MAGNGITVHRLVCAVNTNNVLADFINTGVYDRNRPFVKTASPSMDILISSNLERLLYELAGRDAAVVRGWMAGLQKGGTYQIDGDALEKMQSVFWAGSATDTETFAAIKNTHEACGYTIDTHTGVAKCVYDQYRRATGDGHKTIIAATASPFKFAASVVEAIAGPAAASGKDEFTLLAGIDANQQMAPPAALAALNEKPVRPYGRLRADGDEDGRKPPFGFMTALLWTVTKTLLLQTAEPRLFNELPHSATAAVV